MATGLAALVGGTRFATAAWCPLKRPSAGRGGGQLTSSVVERRVTEAWRGVPGWTGAVLLRAAFRLLVAAIERVHLGSGVANAYKVVKVFERPPLRRLGRLVPPLLLLSNALALRLNRGQEARRASHWADQTRGGHQTD